MKRCLCHCARVIVGGSVQQMECGMRMCGEGGVGRSKVVKRGARENGKKWNKMFFFGTVNLKIRFEWCAVVLGRSIPTRRENDASCCCKGVQVRAGNCAGVRERVTAPTVRPNRTRASQAKRQRAGLGLGWGVCTLGRP